VREYSITQEDVEEVEEIMAESIMNMLLVGADKKYDKINLSELATTSYPGACKVCSFKKICWEE
jgi:Fe-S cluster biogenesis protein NfuA